LSNISLLVFSNEKKRKKKLLLLLAGVALASTPSVNSERGEMHTRTVRVLMYGLCQSSNSTRIYLQLEIITQQGQRPSIALATFMDFLIASIFLYISPILSIAGRSWNIDSYRIIIITLKNGGKVL
jgi:hypothetical protein